MIISYLSTTPLKMAYTGKSSDGWLLANSMSILLLRGSRRTVPIAMSVAGRKYHYPFYWSSHISAATGYSNPGIEKSLPVYGAFCSRNTRKNVSDECICKYQCSANRHLHSLCLPNGSKNKCLFKW